MYIKYIISNKLKDSYISLSLNINDINDVFANLQLFSKFEEQNAKTFNLNYIYT